MRKIGGILFLIVFAALAVYLLVQSEPAREPLAASPTPELVTGEDHIAVTGSSSSSGGKEPIARISAVAYREAQAPRTEHLTLRGTVFADGAFPFRPVGGARVSLNADASDKECASVEASSDGSYLMETECPVGDSLMTLRLRVEKEGWVAWERSVQRLPTHPAFYPERVYDLFLYPPLVVTGSVVDASTGSPIAGAVISQQGRDPMLAFARSTTGSSGVFEARVADQQQGYLDVEAADHLSVRFGWTKTELAQAIVIRLPQQNQIPQMKGRVLGPDGAPCPDAFVVLRYQPSNNPPADAEKLARQHLAYLGSRSLKREFFTDRHGEFSAALPGFGKWTIIARKGDMTASREIEVLEQHTYACDLRLETCLFTVQGTVSAKLDRRPIAGAKVRIHGSGSSSGRTFLSNAQGAFQTISFTYIPGEVFTCKTHAPPFPVKEFTFKAPERGGELRLSVELDEPCRVRGLVVDELGSPLRNVRVRAVAKDTTAEVVADEGGRFEFAELPSDIIVSVVAGVDDAHISSVERRVIFSSPGEVKDVGTFVVRKR